MGGAQHTEQSPSQMSRPRTSRRCRAAALAVASALGLAGCGQDAAPARPEEGRLPIALDDFLIDPQAVRAASGPLTVEVVNRGRVGHNLHVRKGERDVLEVATLDPGGRATASGTLAKGEYTLLCTVGNHRVLGMYGTLTVR
jgi:plastocyanin